MRARGRPPRATGLVVALALWLIVTASASPQVHAQGQSVGLKLVSQTPWASPKHPSMGLEVAVSNGGSEELGDLWLRVSFLEPLLSRSELRLAMNQDTGQVLSTSTFPLTPLGAGETVSHGEAVKVAFLEQAATEARVYPVRIEVAQGKEAPALATLRSALVFVPAPPKEPLNLVWTFVLGHPIEFGPDGVFLGRSLERRIAEGGSLWGVVEPLAKMLARGQDPVDVVISPTLMEDLRRMRDGYRAVTGEGLESVEAGVGGAANAQAILQWIKEIASSPYAEISAMPYAVPDLPQLVASGLSLDIPEQLALGRSEVSQVLRATGSTVAMRPSPPDPEVLRPPGSSLDSETLRILRKEGVKFLLLDEGIVQQPRQPNDFAPPATAEVAPGLTAVVPDEGLQSLITDPLAHEDPSLAAQWVLADLASIWLEQPDTPRATAMIVSGEQDLAPDFFAPLIAGVGSAPWLRTARASNLAGRFPPQAPPDRLRLREGEPMPAEYLTAITENRLLIAEYRSILEHPSSAELPDSLSRDLLLTEGSSMVDREKLGTRWLDSISRRVREEFSKVAADTAQVVTLTSSGGRIPVRVTNASDQSLRVRVELRSERLRFPGGSGREVSLAPDETTVLIFEATAQTTGTFPVEVSVETPSGQVLSQSKIVVRSTAYNLVALLITLGAVLVLLAIWGRRHLSRKRT